MAVKYKISKEEHGKLPVELQGEYNLVGSDYVLDLEGVDMKAAEKFTTERDKRRAAEKRANEAEAKITELEDQYSDGRTAVGKAEKKAKEAEDKLTAANTQHANYVKKTMLDSTAASLAAKLSKTAPKLLEPHIRSRLDVDLTDPLAPKLVILGADGKANADVTLDKLEKDFRDNKDYAAIITASQASGGGASKLGPANGNGNPGSGVPHHQGTGQPQNLAKLSSAEMAARITARRAAAGLPVPEQAGG